MQPSEVAECQHILEAVINSTENGRGVAGNFMDLPDRKMFPDYFQIIPELICLNMIKDRLKKKNHYKTPEDFLKDLHLVFLNAQYYNQDGSGIYKDSVLLERLAFYIYRQLVLKGTLPQVTDDVLLKNMNPPRTKGRPPKNLLIDNYKKEHPDIAALEPPKKQGAPRVNKLAASAPLTTLSASESAEDRFTNGQQPTTPGSAQLGLLSSAQLSQPQHNDSLQAAATTPDPKQALSPNSVPTPHRTSHAAGLARLIAPPAPTSFPQVVIPDKIPGLDDQDFALISQQAQIREEMDKVLEKWPGPAENIPVDPKDEGNKIPGSGWWGDEYNGTVPDWQQLALSIVDRLRGYVDADGNRLCGSLEEMAVPSNIPYLSYRTPLSLQIIANNLISGVYPSMKAFDMDMARLFEKARRYYSRVTPPYGAVLAIQRLYNALTSLHESQEIPQGVPPPSPVAFASFPAGPGNAKPMGDNGNRNIEAREFTSYRVSTKDRVFTNMAKYKGVTYKIGDYVHIINPEDPSRPIPAQVYRSYIPTHQPQRHMVTVCWYFRPEQTVHQPTHLFYEDEVFKTGHMVDHPVEDIIERVGCQFYTKYVRGRPLKGEWYPGWPLYVCVSRYNEKERLTVRIKNWGSCIPEELRKSDFMQVATFEKAPHTLLLHKSPFLQGTLPGTRGVTGFLSDVVGQTANERKGMQDDSLEGDEEGGPEGTTPNGSGERAAKKARVGDRSPLTTNTPLARPNSILPPSLTGPPPNLTPQMTMLGNSTAPQTQPRGQAYPPAMQQQVPTGGHLSGFTASPAMRIPPPAQQSPFGGPHQIVPLNRSNTSAYGPLQGQYPRPLDPSAPVPGPPRPLVYPHGQGFSLNTQPIRPISNTQHQYGSVQGVQPRPPFMQGQPQGANQQQNQQAAATGNPRVADRTIANLYGSAQELDRLCETEALPESTVNMLDRDPATNRVLWFSGPPIDIIVPEKPKHSAAYLAYVAKKRLQYTLGEDGMENGQGVVKDAPENGHLVEEGEKRAWTEIETGVNKLLHGA